MLDVRLPIGALFFILGIMIAGWGYTTKPIGAIASNMGPLPINFDIIWGILMTIFGLAMFSVAKLDEATNMEEALAEEKSKASATELAEAIVAASAAKPEAGVVGVDTDLDSAKAKPES